MSHDRPVVRQRGAASRKVRPETASPAELSQELRAASIVGVCGVRSVIAGVSQIVVPHSA